MVCILIVVTCGAHAFVRSKCVGIFFLALLIPALIAFIDVPDRTVGRVATRLGEVQTVSAFPRKWYEIILLRNTII